MTSDELTDRIFTLIDEANPSAATQDVGAAISMLLATAAAMRGNLVIPLSRETWQILDRLRDDEALGPDQRWEERPACCARPMADPQAERFLRVWSRAVKDDGALSLRFTDLWFRLLLIKAENDQLLSRAGETLRRARSIRNRGR
jgi:hypothetical protein